MGRNHSTKHRAKRFLDKPILRPDDKDNTPTCNQCDEDLGNCDIFNLVTYVLCGFPRVLWDNFLGGTACTLLFFLRLSDALYTHGTAIKQNVDFSTSRTVVTCQIPNNILYTITF